jgi:hypothetical protein
MTIDQDQDKDDANFEAFLRGEGDLAEGLDALAQPSPSATLDAAILARARADVERDERNARLHRDAQRAREANEARGQAANDAPARGRWGVPAGIAATVLAGVLGHQVWNHNADVERAAMAPQKMDEQSDVVSVPAAAPVQAPLAATVQKPPAPSEKRSAPVAKPAPTAPAQVALSAPPAPVVSGEVAPVQEEAAGADKSAPLRYSAPVFERAPAPAPAPAPPPPPAPSMAAAPAPAADVARRVEVTGSRIAGGSVRTRLPADEPDVWLKRISALLASGDKERALVEWRNFRAIHPDYPVAEPLATAIKAAQ